MKRAPLLRSSGILLLAGLTASCSPVQSALAPTGVAAETIRILFWVMTAGAVLILLLVCVLAAIAIMGSDNARQRLGREQLIGWLGIALPVGVLSALLASTFLVLGAGVVTRSEDQPGIRIAVSGELWWWRVAYTDRDGNRLETANEIHLPVGEPVVLELTTADVIHSFWAPNLAGKLDMIPGRNNELTITATQAGVTRGQCAEYCGGAHAFMAFHVVAQEPADFAAWLQHEAGPAEVPADAKLRRGQELFLGNGCGGCHAVRGTPAAGVVGPDLTHIGSRRSLGAGTLPNNRREIANFILNNQHLKPENRMPAYEIFSEAQLDDLAAYLESLR